MTDYLTDFVQESEERITELNHALLTLEQDPNDEEAMESIFRIAHTLKGNCGAMGLESASELAHAIEDLLDAVRADELDVEPELMDVVFDAIDVLETMISEVAATGEIETDPTATIDALRIYLEDATDEAATGHVSISAAEIDDVCSRFDPPADDTHDVYLARLAIADREGVNNGKLVVDALIDAFDLIGTVPSQKRIEAADYDGRFDAVFATAVGKAAIASGLEPVEEVENFEIVDVTDRFDGDDGESAAERAVDAAVSGEGISSEDAQNLEVDDLLDEFSEFDDLDEMVEEVDDDELAAFENMGEAGSFDDLLDGEAVDDLESGPGEPPDAAETTSESDTGTADADAASDDGTAADAKQAAEDADEVEDASAVFNELKDEVEMVGFDELQDELAELEFDEFDDEEEVDMDELLGDDADDSFLDDGEPPESDVDDVLVDAGADDDVTADETDDGHDADVDTVATSGTDVTPEDTKDDLETPADAASAASETGTDDTVETAPDSDIVDAASSTHPTDESEEPDSTSVMPGDETTESTAGTETANTAELPGLELDDEVTAETGPDGASVDETAVAENNDETTTDDTSVTDDGVDEADGADDLEVVEPIDDEVTATPDDEPIDDAAEFDTVDDEPIDDAAEFDTVDDEPIDDAAEFDTVDDEPIDDAAAFGTTDEMDLEIDETMGSEETEDAAASDSFGANVDDEFDPTAGFSDMSVSSADDEDGFDDDEGDFATFDDDAFDDDAFDESTADSVDSDAEPADDGFESDFDEQLDDEVFEGTDEFDIGSGGLDAPTQDSSVDDDSSAESAPSFDDHSAGADEGDEDDAVRIIEEPELEIPDLTIPETGDRPDTDAETDEIQSVRVDVEQIDSLLTLVEGLVTSRVRLRHAAEADDDGEALETELGSLTDLTTDLQETVMNIRLVPLRTVTNRLPRVVRDIAREQDKEVSFQMVGEDVELDRSILDRIGDPLIHLVRNAVDHGIEPPEARENANKPREGTVEVHAERSRDRATITVKDDGGGLDPDRLRTEAVEADILDEDEAAEMTDEDAYDLIFHAGLSTADEVTDVSGRGVGMDVVKRTIEDLDGTVSIDSTEGEGTTVTMQLPVSVAIDEILFVECGGEEFGVPAKAVREIEGAAALETADGESVLPRDDGDYPVIQLADVLETPAPAANGDGMVVRIRGEVREVALHCDRVRGQQEVVVKPFEGFMSDIPGLSGATVRGRGEVVNILDVTTL
ncbi:chemotaxis protein CheA [Natrinema halophilum]|uniref:Chemotaxis protein CheA n=1 Tax=Natrinema halophilum TaxID=1699371 RepID=A0A7D5GJH0_9EURY|nr:chemotaxis protein CheA [Natrinema halophilum]QLG50547.1 Hpt domain-containing protein [Natrinema halophilum]